MNKLIILGAAAVMTACSSVPLTGRKQLKLLPESQMQSMALDNYSAFLKENKVVTTSRDAQMVKRVGQKIAKAAELFLEKQGKKKLLKDFQWEFNLVESPDVNAWCMPGGKVVVYTGILPITQNEDGLAVVMGHEVAHAIAKHGNERMSQGLAVQLGGTALDVALSKQPAQTKNIFMQAYGMGSQVGVLLPFSRKHESEADEIGLVFSAIAGYDVNEAEKFWGRMAKAGGTSVPEFMSTHPSHKTRVQQIKSDYAPQARAYKKKYGTVR